MSLQLYVALALLVTELLVLTFLLMPYVNRVTGPLIERFLTAARIPLRVTLGILTFLFYEAVTEMIRHQEILSDRDEKLDHMAKMDALKQKFRSERNFYLFAFTFTIFIIILRLDVILNNYRLSKQRVVDLETRLGVPAGSEPPAKDSTHLSAVLPVGGKAKKD